MKCFKFLQQAITKNTDLQLTNFFLLCFVPHVFFFYIDRGEKIETLIDKTDHLRDTSQTFQRSSRGLYNTMWWADVKQKVMLGLCAFFIVYLVGAMACGGFGYSSCMGSGSGGGSSFRPN